MPCADFYEELRVFCLMFCKLTPRFDFSVNTYHLRVLLQCKIQTLQDITLYLSFSVSQKRQYWKTNTISVMQTHKRLFVIQYRNHSRLLIYFLSNECGITTPT